MPASVQIEKFLALAEMHPILDVRSPLEFDHGHIPGAINLPLFTDEERKIIGTTYKQKGREEAILQGLEVVGPKMRSIIEEAKKITTEKTFLIHCWRGGMRSASVAWLLEMYGFKVYLLNKGYKSFRKKVLDTFDEDRKLVIIGGRTGSAKTDILNELINLNEQIIDLEKLASHKGSSFGSIGEEKQPSQEQFENDLAANIWKTDPSKNLWVEDESNKVGNKVIPKPFWEKMRECPVMYVDVPFSERVKYLTSTYGKFNTEKLKEAIERIQKKLGGLNTRTALDAIDAGDLKTACEISLSYYDKAYDHGTSKRDASTIIKNSFEVLDIKEIANKIKSVSKQIYA